jgi:hypothetical protein
MTGDAYRLGAPNGAIIVQKPFDIPALARAIDRATLQAG